MRNILNIRSTRIGLLANAVFAILVVAAIAIALMGCASTAGAQYFGKNKIQYRQFDWKIYHSPHFDVFYYAEGEGRLQSVQRPCQHTFGIDQGIHQHGIRSAWRCCWR